jgi:hypothetical protein
VLSYRRDVIVSLLAWVLVLQRSERLQRVGQLLDVLVFVPATLPVVRDVAKYPLRGLSRGLAAQQRFPVVNGPKHHSPLCFAAALLQPGAAPRSHRRHCITGGLVIIGIKGEPLATNIIGEQTFNVGKTDEIAQRIVPPPGSQISFVTSAHDGSRSGFCPKSAVQILF